MNYVKYRMNLANVLVYTSVVGSSRGNGVMQSVKGSKLMCVFIKDVDTALSMKNREFLRLIIYHVFFDVSTSYREEQRWEEVCALKLFKMVAAWTPVPR